MRDWDRHWMEHALLNAEMSTCARRSVGAVAVRDRRLIAAGFNGNAPGDRHCVDGGCARCATDPGTIAPGDALETCVCVHAEANVVAYAARYGVSLAESTIYSTHRPCLTCALLVTLAGVLTVVYANDYPATYTAPSRLVLRKLDA